MESLKHGFGGLLRFTGRDRPGLFWPYAIVVVVGCFFGSGALIAPLVWGLLEAIAQGSTPVIAGFLQFALMIGLVVFAIVCLLAAAVSRRLHYGGRSGWWAVIPMVLLLTGIGLFALLISSMTPSGEFNFGLFAALLLNNIVYLGCFGLLVIGLILPGASGPNRYGEPGR
ncbi:MAG: DUF805 domain-containing protein [Caulobacter sp.]|nr:DUF805 domain-containing protein [Caulobacter sp.]